MHVASGGRPVAEGRRAAGGVTSCLLVTSGWGSEGEGERCQ